MSGFCPHCGYNLVADKPVARDGWEIDPGNREVRVSGQAIKVHYSWAVILHSLASAGRIISAQTLLARISENENLETLRTQVSKLRRHMREHGLQTPIIGHRGLVGGYSWGFPPERKTKHAKDFDADTKRIIRARREHQSAQELAAVFGTTARVIGNIARYG